MALNLTSNEDNVVTPDHEDYQFFYKKLVRDKVNKVELGGRDWVLSMNGDRSILVRSTEHASRLANESMSPTKFVEHCGHCESGVDMPELTRVAGLIRHCGDYGHLYVNEDGEVWWTAGDADNPSNGYHSSEEIQRRLESVPGVRAVHIESEGMPPEGYDKVEYK
jgi:hypothetical protein